MNPRPPAPQAGVIIRARRQAQNRTTLHPELNKPDSNKKSYLKPISKTRALREKRETPKVWAIQESIGSQKQIDTQDIVVQK